MRRNDQVREVLRRRSDPSACPECGATLVERANRRTGERFLGCPRFPACKGARPAP